jgi:DNA polymerase-1
MIQVHQKMQENKMQSKMILQVHDELVFEVLEEELDQLSALVKETMENAVNLDIPLTVDIGIGDNWLEAH